MIKPLPKKTYQDYELIFTYQSKGYYKVIKNEAHTTFEFVYEAFKKPVKKSFTGSLYPSYYEAAEAFGYFDKNQIIGFLEVNHERYNNRLRITEFLVLDCFRKQGIGRLLMAYAITLAKKHGCRAVILETQTCNDGAIAFYQAMGFKIIGFDLISYSNEDIARQEVRLEMGLMFDESVSA